MEDLRTAMHQPARRRSKAWIFYSVLTVLCLIGMFSGAGAGAIVPALLLGAYSVYLYRGGRFVLWIW